MLQRIGAILGAILVLASVVGAMWAVETRYAKDDDVAAVSERLERKIDEDRLAALQKRLWDLEDRWIERFRVEHDRLPHSTEELLAFMTEDARETHRDLTAQIEALKEKLAAKETS